MDHVESDCTYNAQLESVKISLAIRAARSVVGISQGELAVGTGVPRVTLARLETLRGNLRADQFLALLNYFRKMGVHIELTGDPGFGIRVDQSFIERESKNEQLMNRLISPSGDPPENPPAQRRGPDKTASEET